MPDIIAMPLAAARLDGCRDSVIRGVTQAVKGVRLRQPFRFAKALAERLEKPYGLVPSWVRIPHPAYYNRDKMRHGTTNLQLRKTIDLLSKQKKAIWKRLAHDLSMPSRQRRAVNIFRLNRYSNKGETVVVPGKVLGDGVLGHSINVAAYSFSKEAKTKIEKAGGKTLTLAELMSKHPDGKGVKILG